MVTVVTPVMVVTGDYGLLGAGLWTQKVLHRSPAVISQPELSRHNFECQCRHSPSSCHRNITSVLKSRKTHREESESNENEVTHRTILKYSIVNCKTQNYRWKISKISIF